MMKPSPQAKYQRKCCLGNGSKIQRRYLYEFVASRLKDALDLVRVSRHLEAISKSWESKGSDPDVVVMSPVNSLF